MTISEAVKMKMKMPIACKVDRFEKQSADPGGSTYPASSVFSSEPEEVEKNPLSSFSLSNTHSFESEFVFNTHRG